MLEQPKDNIIIRILRFLHEHIIITIIAVVVFISAVSMLLLATGVVKSGSETTTETSTTSSDSTYEDSDTVNLAMNRIRSLNPLSSRDSDTYYISQLIYSSLFRLDKDLNIEKDLVSSYDTGSGKVSIKLRSGVTFSDGSSLTAGDVSYTIDKIKSIGSKSPYYAYARKISSVSVNGSHQLTIYFKSSNDAALDNLVFPIVSSSDYSTGSNYKPMGSGQYKYSSYKSNSYLKLKPNSDYYGDKAENNIKFTLIKYPSKTTAFITTDAVTAYVNTATNAREDASDKDLKYKEINSSEAEYLAFNFKNKALSVKKVRQAMAYAIDTNKLIKDNYGDNAVSSDSIYYPGFLGVKNQGDAYKYDQSKALKLLASAGYKDRDDNGVLEDKNGKELSFKLLVNKNDISRSDAANDIASELENLGFKIQVVSESWNAYKSNLSKGNFDIVVGGFKFDKEYNLRDLFDKGNNLNYSNSVVVSKVDKMETSMTSEEQKTAFEKLKKALNDDIPYYCICYKRYCFVTVTHFTAGEYPTFFDRYRGISTWQWKKTVTPDKASDTYKSS
jgi:peptide/nickel transport system substrate-binding protein